MALYFIGIGLNDEKDITVKGLGIVKRCKYVYLESYTSILQVPVSALEEFYGKKIIIANRAMVEIKSNEIINDAKQDDVAFLVIGDIFGATTHYDLLLRAKKENIKCEFVHNASVMNAIGVVGLELYKYGKTTSIPFPEKGFKPETYYDVLKMNKENGLHTLILLDLRPREQRFVTANLGIQYLLEIAATRNDNIFDENTMVVGCARIGGDFHIKYGKAKDLLNHDFGKPLHCIIVPGKLHFVEEEALKQWG
ncbi:TPA: diphthine synthase [Candidatus Woesearchaeota archaeon]|nr:diphthine synthase [Candidatus Woesearchaeota archaeon]HIH31072.1 diphthine synthase [Candidatus Woesearchaeota archaeon]HIH55301.1 diphthine synthase [Candidatus Woesearchaeota archaeon]HIJ01543.1 diphthine synthase [Candidatus Woesearchaeota archaeon]HIJ13847.1 diphthine synthase [Candidatus Woesearchaeota archaeon]